MSPATVVSAVGVGIALTLAIRLAARDLLRRGDPRQPEAPQPPADHRR